MSLPCEGETRERYQLDAYFNEGEVPEGWEVPYPSSFHEYYEYSTIPGGKPKKCKAVGAIRHADTYEQAMFLASLALNGAVYGDNINHAQSNGRIKISKVEEKMKWQVISSQPVITLH